MLTQLLGGPAATDAFEGVVTVRVIEDLYAFTWTYRDEPLLSHLGRYHD
ncbi:hypothetical protein H4696_001021 [Amycolatopsis lexingtonensis]|uniref:Uncharacterized protein n=1 Tax=Amycolatopsis lexingtonensis TaxID=218822 RepID=A0ABR9HSM4_9PSEU|nr:hypothetical protein [Amycolatopsis lexingtonensis]MBE1493921.1 hypothetical protein [Amycolatopsis lexingtonensis]